MTNLNYTNTSTTTYGDKLKQKLSDWIHNLETGDSDYFAITALDGKMFYVCGREAIEIISCNVLIDKGNGLEESLAYNSNATSSTSPFTLIMKKDKRLIMNNNDHIVAFGVKDVAPTAKTLFVHAKAKVVHTFITASDSSSQVEVFKAMSKDTAADPILNCMNAIFASIVTQHGKEVV